MGFAEWRERFRQALRTEADIRALNFRLGNPPTRGPKGRVTIRRSLLLTRERAELVKLRHGHEVGQIVEAAQLVADGRFRFLGYPEVALERPIDFGCDPYTGKSWPKRHGRKIDYRTSVVGDPKWTWELNRLQFIPLLACAWKLSGRPAFLDIARGDLDTWLGQSSYGTGIGWANGFEAALRAISLALVIDALRGVDCAAHTVAKTLRSVNDHLRWIHRYPSLHSSANNHRLAELVATVVSMSLAPELFDASAYTRSLADMRALGDRLFLSDGGYVERSFAYGVFAADLLLLTAACLPSDTPEPWLVDLLTRAADAMSAQISGDELEPDYGDRDDGRAFILDGSSERTARAMCGAMTVATQHAGAKSVARDLNASAIWLFGPQAVTWWNSTEAQDTASSVWLEKTGIVILRKGATTARFDIGDLGMPPLAAHGHADALQVTIEYGGAALVGDPGTGSYFGSGIVRNAFRGTGFHATVTVDGVDQTSSAGAFLWGRPPEMTRAEVNLVHRIATAAHTGYGRLKNSVDHRRTTLVPDDGLIVIVDDLQATRPHHYAQRWPVHPDVSVEMLEDGTLRAVGPTTFTISVHATVEARKVLHHGQIRPFLGWWSPKLEAMCPAFLISIEAGPVVGCRIVTVVSVGETAPQVTNLGESQLRIAKGQTVHNMMWPSSDELPMCETTGDRLVAR